MANIKLYDMDAVGVVVDTNPIGKPEGAYTKAQNAVPDPSGEQGSLTKRAGWKPFNTTTTSGIIRGGIGVPFRLGSAGLNVQNPYTDLTATLTSILVLLQNSQSNPSDGPDTEDRLGTTFSDESNIFYWDFNFDFDEEEAEQFLDDTEDADLFLIEDEPGSDGTTDATSTFPITYVGDPASYYLTSQQDISDSTYGGLVPTFDNIQFVPSDFFVGHAPGRKYDSLYAGADAVFTGGDGEMTPQGEAVIYKGKMYYSGYTYTQGSNSPPLRVFDGITDRIAILMPDNPDLTTKCQAILAKLVANNKIYISTFDGGTNGSSGGTIKGSVYQYNPDINGLIKLGATFPTGHIPLCLAWAYGRLWCGTAVNYDNASAPGRIYSIHPEMEGTWTLEKTFGTDEEIVTAICPFKGLLYASVVKRPHGGAFTSKVYVRAIAGGTWSSSDATLDQYTDLIVWPEEDSGITSPTPALYSPGILGADVLIRKFDGTSWSTAKTFSGGNGTVGLKLAPSFMINSSDTLKPIMWLYDHSDDFYNTPDGTTWTKRTITGSLGSVITYPFQL